MAKATRGRKPLTLLDAGVTRVKGKRGGRKPLTEFDAERFEKFVKRLSECSAEMLALKNAMKARGVGSMRFDHYAKLVRGIKGIEKFCFAARTRLGDLAPDEDF